MSDSRPDRVPAASRPIPQEFVWVLLLAVILIVGLGVAATWSPSIHLVDPGPFAARGRALLEGALPYFDYEFEHLPLALLPMTAAAILERLVPLHYTLIFWLLMSGVLFSVGHLTNKLGRYVGVDDGAYRWVVISWALLPLLAFRVDALSVLLALLAVTYTIGGRELASAWSMGAAIATKGWPIVLVATDWWRGRRRRAIVTLGVTMVGAAAVLSLPLFRSGRDFYGVHIETVTGAAVVLFRAIRGLPTQVGSAAGAGYVEVGAWAIAANVIIGAGIGLLGIRVLRHRFTWPAAIDLIGALTVAVMLMSPLLSAQFVIWITPFAAVSSSRRVRIGTAGAALLTGIFATFWNIEATWFWALVVARNSFLVWTGWVWVRHLSQGAPAIRRSAAVSDGVPV